MRVTCDGGSLQESTFDLDDLLEGEVLHDRRVLALSLLESESKLSTPPIAPHKHGAHVLSAPPFVSTRPGKEELEEKEKGNL